MKKSLITWIAEFLVKLGFKKWGGKLMGAGSVWFFGEIEAPEQLRDVK